MPPVSLTSFSATPRAATSSFARNAAPPVSGRMTLSSYGSAARLANGTSATHNKTRAASERRSTSAHRAAETADRNPRSLGGIPAHHDDPAGAADSALRILGEVVGAVDPGPALDVDQVVAQLGRGGVRPELAQRVDDE